MKQGILYGVGVGPGDPELLTIKAVRIITEADVVAVPDGQTARKIAASYQNTDDCLDFPANKVFMKAGKSLEQLCGKLQARDSSVQMAENCGMENERIFRSLDEIDRNVGYFSVLPVKQNSL